MTLMCNTVCNTMFSFRPTAHLLQYLDPIVGELLSLKVKKCFVSYVIVLLVPPHIC
jgi:hypothetical protein